MNAVMQRTRAYALDWMLVLLMIVFAITASGCASRPEVKNIEDAIALTSADITSVATQIKALCGNIEPGGDCDPDALIDTDTKLEFKNRLQEAQDALVLANEAVNARDQFEANDKLGQAEGILRTLRSAIASRENEE